MRGIIEGGWTFAFALKRVVRETCEKSDKKKGQPSLSFLVLLKFNFGKWSEKIKKLLERRYIKIHWEIRKFGIKVYLLLGI